MQKQLPKFTFRVDSITLEKLRYIADDNFRTMNKELEMIVHRHIAEYERKHGVIPIHKTVSFILGYKEQKGCR